MSGPTTDTRPGLVGGPFDGARIADGTRPTFVWIGGAASKPRVFKEPGAGRELYRHLAFDDDGAELFVYAGHTHQFCGGCRSFHKTAKVCTFCGHVQSQ